AAAKRSHRAGHRRRPCPHLRPPPRPGRPGRADGQGERSTGRSWPV
ncbi:MAG: hypothetical protein AVDCRST_MAG19-159, partial [uncultured Thermomicrobiales bacterium]